MQTPAALRSEREAERAKNVDLAATGRTHTIAYISVERRFTSPSSSAARSEDLAEFEGIGTLPSLSASHRR